MIGVVDMAIPPVVAGLRWLHVGLPLTGAQRGLWAITREGRVLRAALRMRAMQERMWAQLHRDFVKMLTTTSYQRTEP